MRQRRLDIRLQHPVDIGQFLKRCRACLCALDQRQRMTDTE